MAFITKEDEDAAGRAYHFDLHGLAARFAQHRERAADRARGESDARIAELEAQLAAKPTKPQRSQEDEQFVSWYSGTPVGAHTRTLLDIIHRYTSPPPPKAPPTDAELVAKYDAGGCDAVDVIKALRARGAK